MQASEHAAARLLTRWLPLVAAAWALVCTLPALGLPLFGDDYPLYGIALDVLDQNVQRREWWDLFVLADIDASEMAAKRRSGQVPWWSIDALTVRFFRPIAAASHELDAWLWPTSPPLMHAQSWVLYAGFVSVAAALFQRQLAPRAAAFAALALACFPCNALPVSWLAQRSAILAALFGTGAALLVALARERAGRGRIVLSVAGVLSLGLSLLSAELGVASLALIGWVLLTRPGGAVRSLRRLDRHVYGIAAGCLIVVLAWRWLYQGVGAGTTPGSMYVDPIADPIGFVSVLPGRLGHLLVDIFAIEWRLAATQGAALPPTLGLVARVLGLLVALVGLAALGLALGRGHNRRRLLWTLGCLVASLVPLCASTPGPRLLIVASVLASAALGQALGTSIVVDRLLFGARVAVAGAVMVVAIRVPTYYEGVAVGAFDDRTIKGQSLIVVHAPFFADAASIAKRRLGTGRPAPPFVHVLSAGLEGVTVQRLDTKTLQLRQDAGMLSDEFASLYRGPSAPLQAGARFETLEYTAVVDEVTASGKPKAVTFRFHRGLQNPGVLFAVHDGEDYVAFEPAALELHEPRELP